MSRRVRLVLCSATGRPLGALPPFDVDTPWWPDIGPIVAGARERFGAEVTVLRLLRTAGGRGMTGGLVSYLSELEDGDGAGLPLEPPGPDEVTAAAAESALRTPWARPGGVRAQLRWADETLAALGRSRTGRAVQVKSWNLSSVLRLPTETGPVWCKSTPPMLGDEGAVVALVRELGPDLLPALLAHDPGSRTALFGDVPGEDQWDADEARLLDMVHRLVGLQAAWAAREPDLVAAGLADWRAPALLRRARALLDRPAVRALLTPDELGGLDAFVQCDLPARLDELAGCDLPDTLVHGDAQPLNWRYGPDGLRLLDWGEAGIGSPVLDRERLVRGAPQDSQERLSSAWSEAWLAHRPGCDPDRAATLAPPIAHLRGALVYQGFLDGIEPSEHVYHRKDVPDGLRDTLAALRSAPA